MAVKLRIRVESEFRGGEGDGRWAARSSPFAITVYAKTREEAESRAFTAVNLLLEAVDKQGGLEEYLISHEIPYVPIDPAKSRLSTTRDVAFSGAAG